jgi:RimJ/RimL family protein N-acetyltransferase
MCWITSNGVEGTKYVFHSRTANNSRVQGVAMFAIHAIPSLFPTSTPKWASDPSTDTSSHTAGSAFSGVVGIFNAKAGTPHGDIGLFLWGFSRGRRVSDRAVAQLMRWAMDDEAGPRMEELKYATDKGNLQSQNLAKRLGILAEKDVKGM